MPAGWRLESRPQSRALRARNRVRPGEEIARHAAEPPVRFWRIATAGNFFQGGAVTVDTSTIVAALVHGLTGGTFPVEATTAILAP